MAIETLILFDKQTTEQTLEAALEAFAFAHNAPVERVGRRYNVATPVGLYTLDRMSDSRRDFYGSEYGMAGTHSFYCRASKDIPDGYISFDKECLAIVGNVISIEARSGILMLRNWETPILEKKGQRLILRDLPLGRTAEFLASLPKEIDVECIDE